MKRKNNIKNGLILLIALIFVATVAMFAVNSRRPEGENIPQQPSEPPATLEPIPQGPHIVGTASIGSMGDLLMHMPLITAAKEGNDYNFDFIFSEVKPYFEQFDLMTANLEVTLAGSDRAYTGYPCFNCPDAIVDGAKDGGVDMLLTANNHTNDTGYNGIIRTMDVLSEKGMPFIGTRKTAQDKAYAVVDVNGVKIGMACFTYSTTTSAGRKALNGNVLREEAGPLVNTFDYSRLDEFYSEAKQVLAGMKTDGADATMIYVHWGDEYDRTPNEREKKMAQEMCNMGYDVIVGGHPHVVQPLETLTGENGNRTLCLYSMGNAVSNQRRERMTSDKSGHTEDGLIFGVTFDKYSDGKVVLSDLTIIPTWVDMNILDGKKQYRIVPLDISHMDRWDDMLMSNVSFAKESYNRTMKLVGEGLNAYRTESGKSEIPTVVE